MGKMFRQQGTLPVLESSFEMNRAARAFICCDGDFGLVRLVEGPKKA